MFKNVLVGVDGRLGGRDAIALASRLAEPGATLTFAHVFSGRFKPLHAIIPGMLDEDRHAAQALLEQERAEAGIDADLLVLGTSARGTIGRTLLGSDTRAAINGAPCAIAVAPAGFAEQARPFATIGVGYDGSPESVAAL